MGKRKKAKQELLEKNLAALDKKRALRLFLNCLALENNGYIHTNEGGSFYCKLSRRDQKLEIYFEKSNGRPDWRNNFNFPRTPYKCMQTKWKVHRGFLRTWKSMEDAIKAYVLIPTIKHIEIVGYSHGAPLAALCLEFCKYHRPDVFVEGFGFASPRLIYGKYSDKLLSIWNTFLNIGHHDDAVRHVPLKLQGAKDIGVYIDLTPKGHFWKTEKNIFEKFVAGHREKNIIKYLSN